MSMRLTMMTRDKEEEKAREVVGTETISACDFLRPARYNSVDKVLLVT
jgi:hypothetical protein